MFNKSRNIIGGTAGALVLGFSIASEAEALMLLQFTESEGNVILTVSGSIDLTGLSEGTKNVALGGQTLLDTVNEQLQLGSGINEAVNFFSFTVQNNVFTSAGNILGTVNEWESNTNSIRFQQNNGQVLVDDAVESGDVITVTSTHTFDGRTFADFGLTAGETTLWLENLNASGDDGKVIVTAGVEPAGPSPTLEITSIILSSTSEEVTLTWTKIGDVSYDVRYSVDLIDWESPLGEGISETEDENPDDAEKITRTFPLTGLDVADGIPLFFRIEEGSGL